MLPECVDVMRATELLSAGKHDRIDLTRMLELVSTFQDIGMAHWADQASQVAEVVILRSITNRPRK